MSKRSPPRFGRVWTVAPEIASGAQDARRRARDEWTRAFVIAGVYLVISRLSAALAAEPEHVSALWPPSGFAFAALLLSRRQAWPLLLALTGLACGFANVANGSTIPVGLGLALGNTLEVSASALVFGRIAGPPRGILSRREVGALAAASAAGPAFGGLFGAATVTINLGAPYWQAWRVWLVADGVGTLIVGAIILVAVAGRTTMRDLTGFRRIGEASVLVASLVGVAFLAFGFAPSNTQYFFRAYMVLPFMMWAGYRFSASGAATSMLILTAIGVPLTLSGAGTFAEVGQHTAAHMLSLQVFLGTASLVALTAAAGSNERMLAEEALRGALAYNRGLIEASMNPLFTTDLAGRILDVNPAAEVLVGRTRNDLIGTDVAQHATDPDAVRAGVLDVFARGSVTDFPVTIRAASGALSQMQFTATVLRDGRGDVTGIFGIGRDVTEQRRVEREAETVREVTQLSLSTESVEEFTRQLPGVLSRCLDVPAVHLAMYDAERDEMRPGPAVGLPALSAIGAVPTDDAFTGIAVRSREMVVVPDAMAQTEPRFAVLNTLGVRTCICAPLIAPGGRVLGTLSLGDTRYRPELLQARPTLQAIARNIAEILERARVQAEMRESEERHRALFSQNLMPMLLIDPATGTIVDANGAAARYYGWELPVLRGMNIGAINTLGPGPLREKIDLVSAGQVNHLEFHHRLAGGEVRDVEVFSGSVTMNGRSLLLSTVLDVTARKQAIDALATATELLERTGEIARVGGWELDVPSMRLFWSLATRRILEVDPQVALPLDEAIDLYAPEARPVIQAAVQAGIERGTPWDLEMPMVTAKGRSIWVRAQGFAVMQDGKAIKLVGALHDITDRKRAEDALHASLREQAALLKEVHHRVKNNLQVITSLLRLEAGRIDNAGTKAALAEMNGRIQAMASLHEMIYRSASWAQVNLADYFKQLATEAFRAMAGAQGGVRLHLDVQPITVEMNQAIPCGLIVNELVSNCLKHGFPDGRTGNVSIELQRLAGTADVRLRVSDTGVGLPADFDLAKGRTLGLHLVSDLARQLQSRLDIGTGPGATFSVSFTLRSPP
jgi:PAS domain S-box-containing protein